MGLQAGLWCSCFWFGRFFWGFEGPDSGLADADRLNMGKRRAVLSTFKANCKKHCSQCLFFYWVCVWPATVYPRMDIIHRNIVWQKKYSTVNYNHVKGVKVCFRHFWVYLSFKNVFFSFFRFRASKADPIMRDQMTNILEIILLIEVSPLEVKYI